MQTVQSVYRWKEVTLDHPVLGEAAQTTEKRIVPNENGQEHSLSGIVIDSFTRLAQYELAETLERQNAQREADGSQSSYTPRQWSDQAEPARPAGTLRAQSAGFVSPLGVVTTTTHILMATGLLFALKTPASA